jgi:hypothetical protein
MSLLTRTRSDTSARIVSARTLPQVSNVVGQLLEHDGAAIVEMMRNAKTVLEREYLLSLFVALYSEHESSWIRVADIDDPTAMLVRGAWATGWAWAARTSNVGSQVTESQAKAFRERLAMAEACLQRAVALAPTDVTAWGEMFPVAYGSSHPEQHARDVYQNAILYGPTLHSALGLLTYLTAKWCGSTEKMYQFAATSTLFPDAHPAHLIVPMATIEEGVFGNLETKRTIIERQADAIDDAAKRSILHPSFVFDGPGVAAASAFAYCYAFLEERTTVERILEKTGGYLVSSPFYYLTREHQAVVLGRAKISLCL